MRDRQWGDFQTPPALAEAICAFLAATGSRPRILIEPTAGQGNFLAAAATAFPDLRQLYGVEIQEPYVAAARARFAGDPRVTLVQADIFQHAFPQSLRSGDEELLILGNPPWVTSAELSSLASQNLPAKSNHKGHAGLDARTGKANFDLGEAVLFRLLSLFHQRRGTLALLVKNTVIRSLLLEQPKRRFRVAELRAYQINAPRLFGATVDASLLCLRLGAAEPAMTCDLYRWDESEREPLCRFGWSGDRFVADVERYRLWGSLDGQSPLTWRQGLKHDCAAVMELTPAPGGGYTNGLGEAVEVEPDLLFPLLKSSDLKAPQAGAPRRSVILTQRRIGEETDSLAARYPLLWRYLTRHRARLDGRRSSIYRGQPPFALFGIGAYSFAPYKVAISGMYKAGRFTLVEPVGGQPVMLDDTCYFLGFEGRAEALRACTVLNGEAVQGLLQALAFRDGKRPFTKDLLMRIDLAAAIRLSSTQTIAQ